MPYKVRYRNKMVQSSTFFTRYTAKKMHGKLRVVQLVSLAQKLMTRILPFQFINIMKRFFHSRPENSVWKYKLSQVFLDRSPPLLSAVHKRIFPWHDQLTLIQKPAKYNLYYIQLLNRVHLLRPEDILTYKYYPWLPHTCQVWLLHMDIGQSS
jgi:hypothetical protein